jgi:hypothetical protein
VADTANSNGTEPGCGERPAGISVIIATYKRPHLIGRALDSVAAQALRPAEIIVVDDCSGDDTEEVVLSWASRSDIPVRFVAMESNRGAGAARNRAMAIAGGEYVAFLDSDDEYLPDALERLVEPLTHLPGAVVSFADARIVEAGTQTDQFLMSRALPVDGCQPTARAGLYQLKDPASTLLLTSMIPTCAAIFRRDAALRAGLMPEYRFGEDWLFWLRLTGHGSFVCQFAPVARVHRQDDNLTGEAGAAQASTQVLMGLLAIRAGHVGVDLAPGNLAVLEGGIDEATKAWRYHNSRLGIRGYIRALASAAGRETGGVLRHLLTDPKGVLRAALSRS